MAINLFQLLKPVSALNLVGNINFVIMLRYICLVPTTWNWSYFPAYIYVFYCLGMCFGVSQVILYYTDLVSSHPCVHFIYFSLVAISFFTLYIWLCSGMVLDLYNKQDKVQFKKHLINWKVFWIGGHSLEKLYLHNFSNGSINSLFQ